ncbi:MAG: hypothetical protein IJO76_04035 [Clostridia bacterium]|nr:hypothetical protein [Clostridia bacterium]
MKKGINIWSFAAGSLQDTFTLAKDAGFEGVEVALNAEGEINLASTSPDSTYTISQKSCCSPKNTNSASQR